MQLAVLQAALAAQIWVQACSQLKGLAKALHTYSNELQSLLKCHLHTRVHNIH